MNSSEEAPLFRAGQLAAWNEKAEGQGGPWWLVKKITGPIHILAVKNSVYGAHPQDVEIHNPHPHGMRTWLNACWIQPLA